MHVSSHATRILDPRAVVGEMSPARCRRDVTGQRSRALASRMEGARRFCSTLTLASSSGTLWSTSCTCPFAKGVSSYLSCFAPACELFLLSLLPQLSFLVTRCYYSTASILLRHSSTHFWISFHSLFISNFFGDYRSLRLALSTDFHFPSRTHSSICGLLSLGLYYSQ